MSPIALLLAILPAAQNPTPPAGDWRDVDGIVYVINEDVITLNGFRAQLNKYLQDNPTVDPKRAGDMLRVELVRNAIGAQAGEAMGIDENLVKRAVRDRERWEIERRGGLDQYSAILEHAGMTAEDARGEYRKAVLRRYWEDSRTGEGPNPQQKIIADRFVRPGALRLTYTQIARSPAGVSRIGGEPSKVVLQVLELDPAKVGGSAQLESSAAAVRQRIASGASDFDVEFASFGLASGTSRPTEPLDEARLPETDPDLARLVAGAKEGEVLPVLPPHDKIKSWRVVRLNQRIPAHVPAFKSAEVQKSIRDLLQGMWDIRRLDLARKQQYDSSYIWPSPPDGH